jgi:hypothetical protein
LSRRTSVLDFLKTSSGTCALPAVLFYTGDVIHADDPTEEEPLLKLSFVFQILYFCLSSVCTNIAFFGQNMLAVTPPPPPPLFKIFLYRESVSTNAFSLRTNHDVSSGDDCT